MMSTVAVAPKMDRPSVVDFRTRYARPLALIAPHCDIVERLETAPTTARLRGVLFKSIVDEVRARGRFEQYREYFDDDYSAIPYYPLSDYLVRIAVAGALVATPQRLHEGMHQISRSNPRSFADSLLGRTLIRLLARDPVRLLEQGAAARRQMASYGRWTLIRHAPTRAEMRMENEYVWIESALAGSAAGTFEVQNIKASMEIVLHDRFNGSLFFEW